MIKRKISLCTVLALIFALCIPVHGAVIHEVIEEKELIGGVTYQHIQRLEDYGWQDIYVVQADLKAPGVKLEVLKSNQGESYLETTYQLAVESDALAAVNADFFAAKRGQSGRGSAVGVEIRDGEVRSSASVAEKMNTLYSVYGDERFYVNAFQFDISVTAANGKTDKIKLINKYDDLTGIVMYTDDWAEYSVGSEGGIIEVAVDKNGTVVNKVTESAPIPIPEGGYVLSAHMSYNTFLLDHVQIGEALSVDMKSTPNVELIETAIGGGGVLVSEGKIPDSYSHNISGRQPRTAVGLDESGTVITLLVLDGRRNDAKGMTQQELGALMLELGCYTALNFDGGGSSTMVIDEGTEKTVTNVPSDGSLRKVTNALGVVTDIEDNAPVTSVEIVCDDYVFAGMQLPLSVVGRDVYRREVKVDATEAAYTVNNGIIAENSYYPERSGTAAITASCNGFAAQKDIHVLSAPRELLFQANRISLKSGESYVPILIGKDEMGSSANIHPNDAEFSVSGNAVVYTNGVITAKEKGSAVLTATIGEITANMVISVDGAAEIPVPENHSIPDSQNKESELYTDGAYRFAVFGNTRKSSTLFDLFVMNNALYTMKHNSKFQVFLGADIHTQEVERVCTDYVLAKNYNCFKEGNSVFITIPNIESVIYTGDASIWKRFREDAVSQGENLFIFLDKDVISTHPAELQMFYRTLELATNMRKNVYVFGGGLENRNTITSNVRYINTAGIFPEVALEGMHPNDVEYILVTVNGNNVTFSYKSIMGE